MRGPARSSWLPDPVRRVPSAHDGERGPGSAVNSEPRSRSKSDQRVSPASYPASTAAHAGAPAGLGEREPLRPAFGDELEGGLLERVAVDAAATEAYARPRQLAGDA